MRFALEMKYKHLLKLLLRNFEMHESGLRVAGTAGRVPLVN